MSYVTFSEVLRLTGFKRSFIHARVAAGRFPKRTPAGFSLAEVENWIAERAREKSAFEIRRFEEKVDRGPSAGCWLWRGAMTGAYGSYRLKGAARGAHRVAYEMYVGPIPDGMYVCHRCDVPACVNPAHLFIGDHDANMRDMADKGRANVRVGEDHERAKLTDEGAIAVRRGQLSVADAARKFGMSKAAVYHVLAGRTWKHLLAAQQ